MGPNVDPKGAENEFGPLLGPYKDPFWAVVGPYEIPWGPKGMQWGPKGGSPTDFGGPRGSLLDPIAVPQDLLGGARTQRV